MPEPLRGSNIGHVGLRVMVMAHGVRLTWLQRTVLVAIASHVNKKDIDRCYPSLALLAAETDLSVQSVLAAVRQLVRLGVLTKRRRGFNRSNAYILDADALAGLPRIAVTADAEDGEGLKAGDTSGLKAGTGGSESTQGTGVKVHRNLTVQRTDQKNGTPPTPPRRGGACGPAGDSHEKREHDRRGKTTRGAPGQHGNQNHGSAGEAEDPLLWLDLFNRLVGTDLRGDDPANLRAIKRTIAKGYTLVDAEHVVSWATSTWPGTLRGNFLRPSTVFGEKFGQYLEDAKRATNGHGAGRSIDEEWDVPRPKLFVAKDEDA